MEDFLLFCINIKNISIILKGLLEPGGYILSKTGFIEVALKATGMENNQVGVAKKTDCSSQSGCWALVREGWRMSPVR